MSGDKTKEAASAPGATYKEMDDSSIHLGEWNEDAEDCSPLFACGGKQTKEKHSYTWRELNQIEKRRRAILKRVELPIWKILLFWDGTCLQALVRDWLIWLTLGIYVTIRVLIRLGYNPEFFADMGATDLGIIGGFLSFFLVLFVNQSNVRFTDMYKHSMQAEKCIIDVASTATIFLPRSNMTRLNRYMNAAHVAGYVGLTNTYTRENFFDELNKTLKLLTPKELERINQLDMDNSSDAFREILMWCIKEITIAQNKNYFDAARTSGGLRDKILALRESISALYNYADQPVPFFYIHFLCLLSALYLPLFAVSNAYEAGVGDNIHLSSEIITGLIILVQSIFVIGLRLLGQQMIDPYGDDLEDLSVLTYVYSAWLNSNRTANSYFPNGEEDPEPGFEEEFAKSGNRRLSQILLGAPWDSLKALDAKAHNSDEVAIIV